MGKVCVSILCILQVLKMKNKITNLKTQRDLYLSYGACLLITVSAIFFFDGEGDNHIAVVGDKNIKRCHLFLSPRSYR